MFPASPPKGTTSNLQQHHQSAALRSRTRRTISLTSSRTLVSVNHNEDDDGSDEYKRREGTAVISSSNHHGGTSAALLMTNAVSSEAKSLAVTLRIAEELFTRLILKGGATIGAAVAAEKHKSLMNRDRDGDSVFDIGHSRIAVSCLVLERLCASFPRYNNTMRPIAEAIVRSIFVPDTDTTRELVGSLDCPIVVADDVPADVVELLRPYARKTYAAAFSRISTMLKRYSKTSQSLEIRLKRQAQVFERTLTHWRKTLLRSVFVAWRSTIRRRIFLRAKYRAIFLRLREDECRARAIRLWHQRAMRLRKAALADAAMQQEMAKLKVTSESLQQQIVTLLEQNATLSQDVAELERQRQLLQQEMQDRDRFVVDMNHRTIEAERLGTELINSVLMKQDPPTGATPIDCLVRWGHEVIEVSGLSVDGAQQPLACLLVDSEVVVSNFSFSALGAILGAFAVEGAPPREAILQMHVNPDAAPQLLVQFYGRVTQRPCIVSEAHLRTKQRGVLLLFLASVMRFASSWMFGPPPLNLRDKLRSGMTTNSNNISNSNHNAGGTGAGALSASTAFSLPEHAIAISSSSSSATTAAAATTTMTAICPLPTPSTVTASATWMERVRTQQRWVVVSLAAMNAALLIASDRPQVLSAEEQEDEVNYCSVTASMLEDLVPSSQYEDRLGHVVKAVRAAYADIRKLYLTYSSPSMSLDECWRLLKDSRLAGASVEQISKRKVVSLYQLIRRVTTTKAAATKQSASASSSSPSPHASASSLPSSPFPSPPSSPLHHHQAHQQISNQSNQDLSPIQFTIMLLHIALFEQRRQLRLDNPDAIFFESFMLDNIMRAMRDNALRTDMDQFRHIVRHPLVQAAIARHKIALRRAFHKFANVDDGDSMNRNAFHTMARSCGWINKTVTIDTLNDVFRRVQRSNTANVSSDHDYHHQNIMTSTAVSAASTTATSSTETIDLSEWIECLCAIAAFTFPNPFKPLHEKLSTFIEDKVVCNVAVGSSN